MTQKLGNDFLNRFRLKFSSHTMVQLRHIKMFCSECCIPTWPDCRSSTFPRMHRRKAPPLQKILSDASSHGACPTAHALLPSEPEVK